jgi:hypothetical protein
MLPPAHLAIVATLGFFNMPAVSAHASPSFVASASRLPEPLFGFQSHLPRQRAIGIPCGLKMVVGGRNGLNSNSQEKKKVGKNTSSSSKRWLNEHINDKVRFSKFFLFVAKPKSEC